MSGRRGQWAARVLAVLVAATLGGCAIPSDIPSTPAVPAFSLPGYLLVRSQGRVISVNLEEYVAGSVLSEVSPVGESDATINRILDVQSVLARTYAAFEMGKHRAEGFDLCDSTHCQVYEPDRLRTSRFAAAARAAAARTAGTVLLYRGRPAETLFHADCGGFTAGADSVWGGPAVPYLTAAPDEFATLTHKTWELSVPFEKLRLALNADPRTRVGRQLSGVTIRNQDISGRAVDVVLTGEASPTIRGEELRSAINQTLGDRAIRSTRFSIRRTATDYVFSGSGFGHGVGLCQIGAAARARQGDSLASTLLHYFPGTVLSR